VNDRDNTGPDQPKFNPVGTKGYTGNPGGRPRKLREIEAMLDEEHRTVDQMRETFALLRRVAHGVDEPVFYRGEICGHVRKYDSAWMAMYLERVVGPVERGKIDLSDAPDEVVEYLARKLH
jgi:hypothetical protein